MQTKRYDGTDLRRILTAMVVDQTVCSRVSSQWTAEGLFDATWANLVGGWCIHHLRKYGSPPNGQLTGIFESWARDTTSDDKTVTAVERFLQALSDEHQEEHPLSSDYLLDMAANYFNKVRLRKETQSIQLELDRGLVKDAQSRLADIRDVQLGVGSFVEPADDFGVWQKAFDKERRRPLVTYPGDAGKFFGDALVRGEFYAFMASDKNGKTTYLIDLAYRAVRRRNRVALFDTGDGDQDEVMFNLAMRSSGLPEYAGQYNQPIGWNDEGVIFKEQKLEEVDPMTAYQKFKRISKSLDVLRVSCHPSSSISVEGIEGILVDWERDDWRPDVVVIDYADILAPSKKSRDGLDDIDTTWKQLRRLSQQRHCLVVTATQSSAAAYGKEERLLGKGDFSGRKTKNAHVNGMIGVNVTEKEKDQGCGRLNWVVRRKRRSRGRGFVRVAGSWHTGNPVVVSSR